MPLVHVEWYANIATTLNIQAKCGTPRAGGSGAIGTNVNVDRIVTGEYTYEGPPEDNIYDFFRGEKYAVGPGLVC